MLAIANSLRALGSVLAIPFLPVDASRDGRALDQHLQLNLWIILALAALAHALLFAGLLLQRHTADGRASARRTLRLEYLPLVAFTVLFAWLAARAESLWAQTRYTGAAPEAMQVEVTGMQFAWYFRYPGPDATFGRTSPALVDPGAGDPLGLDPADPHGKDDQVTSELVLPAGREVDVALRAQDVIHGFAIPELRLKQNAIPGQTAHLHFTPVREGAYAVLCTQLCGLGHYRMSATLRVVSPTEFARWQEQHTHRSSLSQDQSVTQSNL